LGAGLAAGFAACGAAGLEAVFAAALAGPAAGLAAAGCFGAADLAGAAAGPGIFSGCWQLGHFTALPASSSFAEKLFPH
jgi:hypothetical protein